MIKNNVIQKKLVWHNILFFGISSALALVGLPLYAYFHGLNTIDWILFVFMAISTMMATTFGHHRLFAHRAFKAHPLIVRLNLFFGAAAFEGSALHWASEHRYHHRYTDQELDPYNIKKGFWHAHMGWFLFERYKVDYKNAQDLMKDKWIKHQHDYWIVWAITAGIALPLAVGALFGSFWGTFFLAVCGRLFIIHQSVFLINSACHMLGKQTYGLNQSARDSWICALLTNGEGYHSFHHRFPSDYRNGIRWYHWDPTKWLIKFYSWMGLASNLVKTPEDSILAIRSEVEREVAQTSLRGNMTPAFLKAKQQIDDIYELLKSRVHDWEQQRIEYAKLAKQFATVSKEKLQLKAQQVQQAKEAFLVVRKEWRAILEKNSALLQAASA